MKRKKDGVRKLVTWCLYVPRIGKVIDFYPTKKAALPHATLGAVVVKMTGLYVVPPEGKQRFTSEPKP